jgi:hypothetical protein
MNAGLRSDVTFHLRGASAQPDEARVTIHLPAQEGKTLFPTLKPEGEARKRIERQVARCAPLPLGPWHLLFRLPAAQQTQVLSYLSMREALERFEPQGGAGSEDLHACLAAGARYVGHLQRAEALKHRVEQLRRSRSMAAGAIPSAPRLEAWTRIAASPPVAPKDFVPLLVGGMLYRLCPRGSLASQMGRALFCVAVLRALFVQIRYWHARYALSCAERAGHEVNALHSECSVLLGRYFDALNRARPEGQGLARGNYTIDRLLKDERTRAELIAALTQAGRTSDLLEAVNPPAATRRSAENMVVARGLKNDGRYALIAADLILEGWPASVALLP